MLILRTKIGHGVRIGTMNLIASMDQGKVKIVLNHENGAAPFFRFLFTIVMDIPVNVNGKDVRVMVTMYKIGNFIKWKIVAPKEIDVVRIDGQGNIQAKKRP